MPRSLRCLFLALVFGLAITAARAQDETPPPIELDIQALLKEQRVLSENVSDQFWKLEATSDRRLVQIPVIVRDVTEPVVLDNSTIKVGAGRFLGWYVAEPPPLERQAPSQAQPGETPPSEQLSQQELMEKYAGGEGITFAPRGGRRTTIDRSNKVPRITRKLTLKPDGMVEWELARVLPNAEPVTGNTMYHLLLNREKLREMKPDQPRRSPRSGNESAADYRRRIRQERAEYARKVKEFNETRREVMNLPKELSDRRPQRLWAIFDMSVLYRDLKIDGPPPLPWEIPFPIFERMRGMVSGQSNQAMMAAVLGSILQDPHPYSRRAGAVILTDQQNLNKIEPRGPLATMFRMLLTNADIGTRRLLVGALAEGANAGDSGPLLIAALQDEDAQITFSALKGLLRQQRNVRQEVDPEVYARLADAVQRLLGNDEHDIAVQDVLDVIGETVRGGGGGNTALVEALAEVDLSVTPEADRPPLIAFVIRRAASKEQLANTWLSRQMLGGDDHALARATLLHIKRQAEPAPTAEQESRPAASAAPPAGYPGGMPPDMVPPGMGGPSRHSAARRGSLDSLPIQNAEHGLIGRLTDDNAEIQGLAWDVLPQFKIEWDPRSSHSRQPQEAAEQAPEPSPYQAIAEAATSVSPTPVEAVWFLEEQSNNDLRQNALTQLAAAGAGPGQALAVRFLASRGGRALGEAMNLMRPDQRQSVGEAWYAIDPEELAAISRAEFNPRHQARGETAEETGGVPLVVGLLREPGGRDRRNEPAAVVRWFAEEVAAGRRPHRSVWAKNVGATREVLQRVLSKDEDFAMAAASAMVSTVGGTEADARQLYDTLQNLYRSKGQGITLADLESQWQRMRQEILQRRLAAAAGAYELVVVLDRTGRMDQPRPGMEPPMAGPPGPPIPGGMPQAPPSQPERTEEEEGLEWVDWADKDAKARAEQAEKEKAELNDAETVVGEVQLRVSTEGASFGGTELDVELSEDPFGLRLPRPQQLEAIADEKGIELPSVSNRAALLLPTEAGNWEGDLRIGNRPAKLILRRPTE